MAPQVISATPPPKTLRDDASQSSPEDSSPPKQSSRRCGRSQRLANRTFVEHKYHDHYDDPDPTVSAVDTTQTGLVSSPRGGNTTFPEKLHSMLTCSEQDGYEDIVSWQPHGRCFVIHQKDNFVIEVMPRFFHQSKLTSFQRQLNLYGFIRLTAGKDRGAYYHEFFLRGRPDLTYCMTRTRVKGNGMKAASSPETEPDFYSMKPCAGSLIKKNDQHQGSESMTEEDNCRRINEQDAQVNKETDGQITNTIKLPPSADQSFSHHFPSLIKPRVISPPTLSYFLSTGADMGQLLDEAIATTCDEPTTPSTGDVVWFEGHQFRYLDHIDVENFENIMSNPKTTS